MPLSDYIVTDDLTIVLGVIGISVYLLQNFYKPQPLVHPILLGRQSDVGRVRHPTESPVYRNYGTGLMGRFPIKPDKDVNVVNDMVRPQFEARRTLWSTKITNAQLNERVDAFGAGISRILREDSNVLLLLNDGIEFLIADLALAKRSIASMTLCSPKLLSRVLETHPPTAIITDAGFVPLLLELIYDAQEHDHKIIVVGKYEGKHHPKTAKQVEIIPWTQVETDGANITESIAAGAQRPNDPYTLAFFEAPSGKMQAVRFTHENMTSGVAAIRALFPPSMALSGVDTIVSNHSLSTPYGRAIAYSALYENASFATIDSTRMYDVTRVGDTNDVQLQNGQPHNLADVLSARRHPIPYPTVLFIGPDHLEDLSSSILKHARESWLYSFAWRHKLAAFAEGFLSKDSLWDRMVFDNARERVLGGMANALKVVIISGGPISSEVLTPARIALSIPMINMHVNPWVSGPLFATQAFDTQVLPSGQEPAHVGGPTVNVEAKLKGVKDTYLEEDEDPVGEIVVRGPTVGASVGEGAENVAWQEISEIGRAMTNGAFKVVGVCTA
ncbi:hypothetical protein EDD17DRAFT_1107278 [Pisolithus thermaeus]|nr:hypothetical protein EV401DRAFT_280144 [Pisolithus croceorrhizus]KAI6167072.1 hypothetical protein EDD17DRAFT_1107278 [Pisolithus thermaeus]